jgi:hypothetical protein
LESTIFENGFNPGFTYLSAEKIKTETWQHIIDYIKKTRPDLQDRVFKRMFRDFAHVEERLNRHKDYFAAWEQEGVPYDEYIVKHHEQELKKMDVAIISAEKVGKSWTGWGNTYASETYGLNTEAVLAVERGEDIFMQLATYYEKGVRKGEVRMIEVDKKLQSTLVASRLVEWAQKMLIEAGAEELVIKTAKPNVIKYAARKNYVFSHKENFGRSVLSVFIKKVDV